MNLSLTGCGGMGVYHIGVVSCFRTYAPHVLFNKVGDEMLLVNITILFRFLDALLGLWWL